MDTDMDDVSAEDAAAALASSSSDVPESAAASSTNQANQMMEAPTAEEPSSGYANMPAEGCDVQVTTRATDENQASEEDPLQPLEADGGTHPDGDASDHLDGEAAAADMQTDSPLPNAEAAASSAAASAAAAPTATTFAAGTLVLARYKGAGPHAWYPACVRTAHEDGTFAVDFEDGDAAEHVAEKHMKLREPMLPAGSGTPEAAEAEEAAAEAAAEAAEAEAAAAERDSPEGSTPEGPLGIMHSSVSPLRARKPPSAVMPARPKSPKSPKSPAGVAPAAPAGPAHCERCAKAGRPPPSLRCFARLAERCRARDGFNTETSRWHHVSALEHFCQDCVDYYSRGEARKAWQSEQAAHGKCSYKEVRWSTPPTLAAIARAPSPITRGCPRAVNES
jgi:hypothetical protein